MFFLGQAPGTALIAVACAASWAALAICLALAATCCAASGYMIGLSPMLMAHFLLFRS